MQLTVRLLPPGDNSDPAGHFLASVNELFEYALQDVSDSDMVGITIQNQVNQKIRPSASVFGGGDLECL